MHPHVYNTTGVLSECLVTVVASKGLLAGVNSYVLNDMVPLFKLLFALQAFKGFVPFVTLGYMSDKERVLPEVFSAKTAGLVPSRRLFQADKDLDASTLAGGR